MDLRAYIRVVMITSIDFFSSMAGLRDICRDSTWSSLPLFMHNVRCEIMQSGLVSPRGIPLLMMKGSHAA